MPESIITRFAPSPTGYLHIGGARTALFNWAFAKRHAPGGTFILRIEDTDVARSTPEATRRIIEDLQWLGLSWDEGPAPGSPGNDVFAGQMGPHGPYFQSQRGHLYKACLQKLIDLGRAYPDKGAYRFKMPGTDVTVHDLVLGDVTIKADQLEDFIIMKGEAAGSGPTFHFANVVDDATMGVTHVLRAQEHLMNTPKHVALFEALGLAPPRYAHMPLIFNADGSKMSKRDKAKTARQAAQMWLKQPGNSLEKLLNAVNAIKAQGLPSLGVSELQSFLDKKSDETATAIALAAALNVSLPEIDVHDFRVSGYLPEVILNYIALLGWSPGGNIERFDLEWFCQNFSLEGIGKSNARFDRAKLLAFNAEAIAKLPPDVFLERWRVHLQAFHPDFLEKFDEPRLRALAELYRPRSRTLDEPVATGRFFALPDDQIAYDPKAVEKVLKKNDHAGAKALRELLAELEKLEPWTAAAVHPAIEAFAQRTSRGLGDVAQPLRVAVSGTAVSPPIHETLALLGKASTLARIRRCLELSSS